MPNSKCEKFEKLGAKKVRHDTTLTPEALLED